MAKKNCRVLVREVFANYKLTYQDIHRKDINELFTLLNSIVKCSIESKYIVNSDSKTEHLQYAYFKDANDEDLLCFELCGFICICPNQSEDVADRVCSKLENWINGLLYQKQERCNGGNEEIRSIASDSRRDKPHKERIQSGGKRLGRGRKGRKPKRIK